MAARAFVEMLGLRRRSILEIGPSPVQRCPRKAPELSKVLGEEEGVGRAWWPLPLSPGPVSCCEAPVEL